MPSPKDDLFTAFQEGRDEDVISLITKHPELVNATHPECDESLMKMAILDSRPLDLMKFIVSRPNFDFTFLNLQAENNLGKDESNIDALINDGRVDVINFLVNDPKILPKVIVNNQKLTYECAREQLGIVLLKFNKEFKKNPDSKTTLRAKVKIENLEKITSMLAEATINYALAKDDPALCARLEKAGFDLDQPLSSGEKPVQLLERFNLKLLEWFGERFTLKAAQRPVIDLSCVAEERKLRAEFDAASQRFFAKQTDILEKATAGRQERMEKTANPSNPSRKM